MRHHTVATNQINLHVVEAGAGPAVLLCHGFPETWRSWRRQIETLAAAGFRVIAPDMRGHGGSSAPDDAAAYTQLHVVGDLVGLLDALAIDQAAVIGHDWGAVAAWNAAMMRPDRFVRVAGLSVPYVPRGDVNLLEQARGGAEHFYMLDFQQPQMDAALAHDVEGVLKTAYYASSGAASEVDRWDPFAAPSLNPTPAVRELPAWLDPDDFAHAVATLSRTGFHGGLNWYRAIDATFTLLAAFRGARVMRPALFIAGKMDAVARFFRPFVDALPENVPYLTRTILIEGTGHWVQQEAPDEVNAALIEFLGPLHHQKI